MIKKQDEKTTIFEKKSPVWKKAFILLLIGFFTAMSCSTQTYHPEGGTFEILAHRGTHVNWEKGVYDPLTGCEALHIYPPRHDYIENTIESIHAAFIYGATIVEIDIRRTADNHLVVHHDSRLECKTDGTGRIEDRTLEYLRKLDLGYGYTPDDGKTYPLRGKGIGKMSTLLEVLARFPNRKFLIDQKDGSMETAKLLVDEISTLSEEQLANLYYWGPEKSYEYVKKHTSLRYLFATKKQVKDWLLTYMVSLGISGFPAELDGLVLGLPTDYLFAAWGWPEGFLNNIHKVGGKFYLMVETAEDAREFNMVPHLDGIITDNIDIVGPYFRHRTLSR